MNNNDHIHRFKEIANDLLAKILRGEITPDTPAKSIRSLSKLYEASPGTICSAIDLLKRGGYIVLKKRRLFASNELDIQALKDAHIKQRISEIIAIQKQLNIKDDVLIREMQRIMNVNTKKP